LRFGVLAIDNDWTAVVDGGLSAGCRECGLGFFALAQLFDMAFFMSDYLAMVF
jgi:hypothetical protein